MGGGNPNRGTLRGLCTVKGFKGIYSDDPEAALSEERTPETEGQHNWPEGKAERQTVTLMTEPLRTPGRSWTMNEGREHLLQAEEERRDALEQREIGRRRVCTLWIAKGTRNKSFICPEPPMTAGTFTAISFL